MNSQPCSEYIQHKNNIDGTVLICPNAMAEDLRELYQDILKTHPNPYIYCSKEELDSAYTAAQNALLSPKNVLDFSLVLTGFQKSVCIKSLQFGDVRFGQCCYFIGFISIMEQLLDQHGFRELEIAVFTFVL